MNPALSVWLILIAASTGAAHQTSRAKIELDLDAGRAFVQVAAVDLDLLQGKQGHRARWADALRLEEPGGWVPFTPLAEERRGDTVHVELVLAPQARGGPCTLSWLLFAELDPEHCALIRVVSRGSSRFRELTAGERWELELSQSPPGAWDAGLLGVTHVLAGWDHLAFVAALVLGACGCGRGIALAVSAFTAGHALSLLGLVLGCPTPPALLIELGIALSVVYAGAATALSAGEASASAQGPLLAGAFGVLHGLGFGGALDQLGLRGLEAALPVASFNLGVEGAQLLWAAGVFLICSFSSRIIGKTPAIRFAAVAIGVAGAFMFCAQLG